MAYSKYQRDIIEYYLKKKEPYTHDEKESYVQEFIIHYAWIMRYVYCHYVCPCSGDCDLINELQTPK